MTVEPKRIRGIARPSQQEPLVVVSNAFSDDNRGGAAITGSTIGLLNDAFPRWRVALESVQAGSFRSLYRHTLRRHPQTSVLPPLVTPGRGPWPGVRAVARSLLILLFPRISRGPAMKALRQASLVVSKGGFVFVDRGGARGLMALWLTTFPLILAARLGIPFVLLGCTVGPFHERLSRIVASICLRRARLIVVRDSRSAVEVRSIARLRGQVVESPDIVFRLSPPSTLEQEEAAQRFNLGGETFGVVTIRSRESASATIALARRLALTATDLLNWGVVQRLAVVVQTDGDMTSDRAASQQLIRLLQDPRASLIAADLSPRELMALYGKATFIIACRLHSAIFAMIAGTPAVAVSLDREKTEGVFEGLGLAEYVIQPDFEPARASELVASLARDDSFRPRLRRTVANAREEVDRLPELLKEACGSGALA
jgi:polysaccharide pyruvyl transferase WcaK-like protein